MPDFVFMQSLKYLWELISAFSLCAVSCVPTVKAARSIGAVDIPKDARRMHVRPVPRAGGIALFFSFCICSCAFLGVFSSAGASLLSGGALLCALGLSDDVFSLSAKTKLLAQLVTCSLPLFFGIRIGELSFFSYKIPLAPALSLAFSLLWCIAITNAFNFIDGLDGLCAGVSIIISLSLALRAHLFGNAETSLFCFALGGALLGFLPHNAHPAKTFMGDCGSLFIGYSLSLLSLLCTKTADGTLSVSPLALLFIFAYPVFDLVCAVLRRLLQGKSIFSADRGHVHHKLCDRGYTHRQSVALLCTVSVFFCLVSFLF
jgi:UDP-GlcNAc:undecaprenyl-phosphate GlcNAc-1-phosphate transferase